MISINNDKSKSVLHLAIFISCIFAAIQLVQFLPGLLGLTQPYILFAAILTLLALLLTQRLLSRENLTLATLGLFWSKSLWKNSALGLLLGTAFFIVMIGVLILSTNLDYRFDDSTNIIDFLVISASTLIALSIFEEVVFRGYFLFKLKYAFGTRTAIYVTSIIFGLYHGLSFEAAFGPFTFGLVFAVMALKTQGLILPIVFHFMLNWMQALFGMKEKYTSGVFELIFVGEPGVIEADTLELAIHLIMAIGAIIYIERYIKAENSR